MGSRPLTPHLPRSSYPPSRVTSALLALLVKTSQGWGRSFEILNSNGQRVFQADESVRCCGPLYDVKILDNGGNGVMDLTENCACACTREMKVCDISGEILAFVTLHWNNMVTHLSVKNSAQDVVLMIIGPGFRTNIFGNVSFEVKSHDEQHVVGMIKNEQFVVSFPLDLEVTIKAALLGSCLYLINYLTVKEKFKTSQGWGRSFEILNSNGQRVFQADESVRCCGPLYDVKILDNGGNGVMDLTENCACACTREMKVCDISGEILAFVTLHWNNMVTHLSVKNSAQDVVLMIIGPGFRTNIFGNVSFEDSLIYKKRSQLERRAWQARH